MFLRCTCRGQSYDVTITNALVDPNEDNVPEHGEYWFGPGDTNLHLHGLHAATGVPSQATATEYKVNHATRQQQQQQRRRDCRAAGLS